MSVLAEVQPTIITMQVDRAVPNAMMKCLTFGLSRFV